MTTHNFHVSVKLLLKRYFGDEIAAMEAHTVDLISAINDHFGDEIAVVETLSSLSLDGV